MRWLSTTTFLLAVSACSLQAELAVDQTQNASRANLNAIANRCQAVVDDYCAGDSMCSKADLTVLCRELPTIHTRVPTFIDRDRFMTNTLHDLVVRSARVGVSSKQPLGRRWLEITPGLRNLITMHYFAMFARSDRTWMVGTHMRSHVNAQQAVAYADLWNQWQPDGNRDNLMAKGIVIWSSPIRSTERARWASALGYFQQALLIVHLSGGKALRYGLVDGLGWLRNQLPQSDAPTLANQLAFLFGSNRTPFLLEPTASILGKLVGEGRELYFNEISAGLDSNDIVALWFMKLAQQVIARSACETSTTARTFHVQLHQALPAGGPLYEKLVNRLAVVREEIILLRDALRGSVPSRGSDDLSDGLERLLRQSEGALYLLRADQFFDVGQGQPALQDMATAAVQLLDELAIDQMPEKTTVDTVLFSEVLHCAFHPVAYPRAKDHSLDLRLDANLSLADIRKIAHKIVEARNQPDYVDALLFVDTAPVHPFDERIAYWLMTQAVVPTQLETISSIFAQGMPLGAIENIAFKIKDGGSTFEALALLQETLEVLQTAGGDALLMDTEFYDHLKQWSSEAQETFNQVYSWRNGGAEPTP